MNQAVSRQHYWHLSQRAQGGGQPDGSLWQAQVLHEKRLEGAHAILQGIGQCQRHHRQPKIPVAQDQLEYTLYRKWLFGSCLCVLFEHVFGQCHESQDAGRQQCGEHCSIYADVTVLIDPAACQCHCGKTKRAPQPHRSKTIAASLSLVGNLKG